MTRHQEVRLSPGKPFPNLKLKLLSGERIAFPGRSGGKLTALLIYCIESCSACRQQLMELTMIRTRRRNDLRIIGASCSDREHVAKTMWDLNISFPIAYDLDAAQLAGASTRLHDGPSPTIYGSGFLLDAEGKVLHAFYDASKCWSQPIDWLKLPTSAIS